MIRSRAEFVVATRKSPLAMAQTAMAVALLEERFGSAAFRIEKMVTTGDKRRQWSLQEKGGKGLFTKELEDALLEGRADLAVHSSKDLPSQMPDGLCLAGFLPREEAHDVLILREGVERPGSIASGSPRRRMQMRYLYPEAEYMEIRGNVDTRLKKIADGQADATLLAAAGLKRLGIDSWPGLVFRPLTLDECVPAVGQAAVAVQCREEDAERFTGLFDEQTAVAVKLERAFLERLGGGCQVAFAVHYAEGTLRIFHHQCGRETRAVPAKYAATHADKIAASLIEQLELA